MSRCHHSTQTSTPVTGEYVMSDLPSVDKKNSGARNGWEGMIGHVAHSGVIHETSDKQQES